MTEKEKMLSGLPYKDSGDGLLNDRLSVKNTLFEFNNTNPTDTLKCKQIIKSLLGKIGETFNIEQPFHCDYGYNIYIGENFYSNFNLTILDCAKVTIGDNCMFGPNVNIYTAGHPIHAELRNTGYEYAFPVTIGNNVWIGGNTVINPNVTIGDNTVIGSGSVVTKDIPSNVVSVGNPCRVIKQITDEDKKYYYKNLLFEEKL